MELHPTLHLSLVAIEKGAFESPSTSVDNFTYLFLNISSNFQIDLFDVQIGP